MVAYSFRQRFVGAIRDGRKTQTVRTERKRHARPGEIIQIYTGMRTKQCRLVGTATCASLIPIRFDFEQQEITLGDQVVERLPDLDAFAASDGFEDYRDLCAFWRQEHEFTERWEGLLVRWTAFQDTRQTPG